MVFFTAVAVGLYCCGSWVFTAVSWWDFNAAGWGWWFLLLGASRFLLGLVGFNCFGLVVFYFWGLVSFYCWGLVGFYCWG